MTEHDYRRQLSAVADAAEAEIDRYEQTLTRIRDALVAQELRATNRRLTADHAASMRAEDLRREAKLIESVVRQIRKAMT